MTASIFCDKPALPALTGCSATIGYGSCFAALNQASRGRHAAQPMNTACGFVPNTRSGRISDDFGCPARWNSLRSIRELYCSLFRGRAECTVNLCLSKGAICRIVWKVCGSLSSTVACEAAPHAHLFAMPRCHALAAILSIVLAPDSWERDAATAVACSQSAASMSPPNTLLGPLDGYDCAAAE